jgi:hypothetical protein
MVSALQVAAPGRLRRLRATFGRSESVGKRRVAAGDTALRIPGDWRDAAAQAPSEAHLELHAEHDLALLGGGTPTVGV